MNGKYKRIFFFFGCFKVNLKISNLDPKRNETVTVTINTNNEAE